MYRHLERRLAQHVRDFLLRAYGLDLPRIAIEQPPKVEFGEYALPLAFELAKKLRKAPRKIAEEILAGIGPIEGFEKLEVAGAGYINARVNRAALAARVAAGSNSRRSKSRLARFWSSTPASIPTRPRTSAICATPSWEILLSACYARRSAQSMSRTTSTTPVRKLPTWSSVSCIWRKNRAPRSSNSPASRASTTTAGISTPASRSGTRRTSRICKRDCRRCTPSKQAATRPPRSPNLISVAVLRRHLETMDRLDIEYDFLPRESEILHLHFWDAAFAKLKEAGVLTFETEGKNKGCWVMQRVARAPSPATAAGDTDAADENQASEEDQKVIVRSNGTVGYVGKDIAYHMWKFGLLGRDFGYRKFYRYPNGHDCWISTSDGEKDHPHFGDVAEIYNVIDARQAEAQNTVIEALRGLGHNEAADHYTHFSYEMVALTPRCAAELGYKLSEEDKVRSYIEVSGRKGFGVKADDLLDTLIASAKKEVDPRHPQLSDAERLSIATQIAIGALRYFMLKFTKNSVIAFDFKEALSFEGETGPYAQYAVVRASNIFRKGGFDPEAFCRDVASSVSTAEFLSGKGLTISGSCGWRRRRLPTLSISALPPPSPLIWPNTPFNWHSFLTPSITAIRSSPRAMRAGEIFCWPQQPWSDAN